MWKVASDGRESQPPFHTLLTQAQFFYQGIDLLRRDLGDEVEFVTIMWFDSIDAVRTFAGEDYEAAVVPPKARALLSRFDARSQHYEVRVGRDAVLDRRD